MTVTVVHSQGPTESTAQDGHINWYNAGAADDWDTMANATDGESGEPSNSLVNLNVAVFVQHATNDKWQSLTRGIILFDTSGIGSGNGPVTGAVVSIEGKYKNNPAGSQNVNMFSFAPASNTTLTADDWDNVGETKFCDSDIAYANWDVSDVNTFTFNSSGIAAVDLDGISKFCFRDTAYDHSNTAPTHSQGGAHDANIQGWAMEENTAGDKRPFITITHGVVFTPRAIMF